jgi:hypothetical protein
MANNSWAALVTQGTAANRPTNPDITPGTGNLYIATDTGVVSIFAAGVWSDVSGNAGNISTGLTASVTQTLAGALQLTGDYNNVTVVGTAADAVKLPAATLGKQVWVTNSAASNAMGVFPQAATDIIDGGSAGAKVTVSAAKSALFTCLSAGVWQSIGSAARAA